jgi:hypothetical protein
MTKAYKSEYPATNIEIRALRRCKSPLGKKMAKDYHKIGSLKNTTRRNLQ